MVTRRISLTLAALAGIGLAVAQGAGAQIVQTFTVPTGTAVPWNGGAGFNFVFNLFDSTIGVLDEVNIALSTNITADVDIFNNTGIAQSFTNATASIPVTLTAPDAIMLSATGTATVASGVLVPGDNQFPGLPASANSNTSVPMADWLGNYEGIGLMTGNLNALAASGSYSGVANPGVFFGGSAVAGATITITYVYQPAGTIPEPGATTFLAAGVLGSLGMVIRRRRRK